jgi:hypothetical protein
MVLSINEFMVPSSGGRKEGTKEGRKEGRKAHALF